MRSKEMEGAMGKADDYVKGVMSSPVVHVAPHATVAQSLRTMIDHDIGAVVVRRESRRLGCSRSAI